MKRLLIFTGPQGSRNYLWSKIFAPHTEVVMWVIRLNRRHLTMLRRLFQLLKPVKQWGFDYEDDYTFTQRALKEYREHISHNIQP
jgi:hypothetical protein